MVKREFKSDGMLGEAWFSEDEAFRYYLSRTWDPALPPLVWVMLNPSTATERVLDPTIRKCVKFAKREGYGGVVILNLFGLRSPFPADLRKAADPVGPENDDVLREHLAGAAHVVCAWGTDGDYLNRDRDVWRLMFGEFPPLKVSALRVTKGGHPGHPLYIPDATPLEPFRVRRMKLETVGGRLPIREDRPGFKPKPFSWKRRA